MIFKNCMQAVRWGESVREEAYSTFHGGEEGEFIIFEIKNANYLILFYFILACFHYYYISCLVLFLVNIV